MTRDRDPLLSPAATHHGRSCSSVSYFLSSSLQFLDLLSLPASIKNRAPAAYQVPYRIILTSIRYCFNAFLSIQITAEQLLRDVSLMARSFRYSLIIDSLYRLKKGKNPNSVLQDSAWKISRSFTSIEVGNEKSLRNASGRPGETCAYPNYLPYFICS